MNDQSSDFRWFKENHRSLFDKYGDSYLAIKNKAIIGKFASYAEGVIAISKTEAIGTFIVQHCTSDDSGYTNYIYSMNY